MEEQGKNIQDYIIALRKRMASIFIIFAVILIVTVSIAFLLPPIYKSSSTILIEQQDIPVDLVKSTVTGYAAERIQTIQARVMSRTNLLKIIEKFSLYKDESKVRTKEEIIATMRNDVSLDVISASVVDPRTGRRTSATIAFSLSYEGESPAQVQRVTNELTTLYLNENLTSRAQNAADTAEFFEEENKRYGDKVDELENKLALFKQKHASSLPELKDLNLGILQRNEAQLIALDNRLRTLNEQIIYLANQLALIDPGDPDSPGSAERLKLLLAAYTSARSRYSDEHPDVLRLKNEIGSLENEIGQSDNIDVITENIKTLNTELASKKSKYTAEHPDIISLEEKINALNDKLVEIKRAPADEGFKQSPSNPTYITIKSQLSSAKGELEAVKVQRKNVLQKINEMENILFETPQIEREYRVLMRDYKNNVSRYQQTKAKQMQADVAKQLESESKGEKFTLIDPAAFPEKPISPNRLAIVFFGFILALGGGLGFAIVADAISGAVRGARNIKRLLGTLPLAVIPYEMNLQEKFKVKQIKKRVVILFVLVILVALLFIHFVVSPLDVMWFRVLRKIDAL